MPKVFKIPGGSWGFWLVCCIGLLSCLVTLVIGFFPPDGINMGKTIRYEFLFGGGLIAVLLPVLFFYYYHAKQLAANAVSSSKLFQSEYTENK